MPSVHFIPGLLHGALMGLLPIERENNDPKPERIKSAKDKGIKYCRQGRKGFMKTAGLNSKNFENITISCLLT